MKRVKPIFWILGLGVFLVGCHGDNAPESPTNKHNADPVYVPNMKYGVDLNKYIIEEGEVQKNQVLSEILSPFGVGASAIDAIARNSKEVFDVRKIQPNKKWRMLLTKTETGNAPAYFIYESTRKDYVVFDFNELEEPCYKGSHPTQREIKFVEGVINSSLYQTLENVGAPHSLAMEMASLYAWTIDFYRIQEDDGFQVLYEVETIDGQNVSEPKVLACEFYHKDRSFLAYSFKKDGRIEFYDEEGGSMRKAFLKAPVEYTRISSRFQKKRFHPVLKRYKSHLGTDYAAPHGTPIVATADGTVTKSSYTRGNGKYVKIRHNGTYETQYLHMSKRAVKAGDFVQQGDVIGYVGSTGLATGPHVCYRFWKNGKQVDPLRQDLPPSEPLPDSLEAPFNVRKEQLNKIADSLRNEVVL